MNTFPVGLASAIVTACAAVAAAELPRGERFPELKGEYLTGRRARLPADCAGKVALVAMGFTYDSRFAVEAWVKRFRAEFGKEPGVTFYEVPMIGGMARMGKWFIDGGMRRGTPKEDHERVITVYSGTAEWKQRAGYRQADAAYLVLLDAEGKVRWRFSGRFDEAAYQELAKESLALLRR